ncbi:hypothetical protein TWF730_008704 [Orbilia blumenaviensis]|uniref:Uncharacterized protein n=1 Tax=Orbilia blumenaviensis TaxID=1796055 RepID=A0AAV9V4R8_9PEZI
MMHLKAARLVLMCRTGAYTDTVEYLRNNCLRYSEDLTNETAPGESPSLGSLAQWPLFTPFTNNIAGDSVELTFPPRESDGSVGASELYKGAVDFIQGPDILGCKADSLDYWRAIGSENRDIQGICLVVPFSSESQEFATRRRLWIQWCDNFQQEVLHDIFGRQIDLYVLNFSRSEFPHESGAMRGIRHFNMRTQQTVVRFIKTVMVDMPLDREFEDEAENGSSDKRDMEDSDSEEIMGAELGADGLASLGFDIKPEIRGDSFEYSGMYDGELDAEGEPAYDTSVIGVDGLAALGFNLDNVTIEAEESEDLEPLPSPPLPPSSVESLPYFEFTNTGIVESRTTRLSEIHQILSKALWQMCEVLDKEYSITTKRFQAVEDALAKNAQKGIVLQDFLRRCDDERMYLVVPEQLEVMIRVSQLYSKTFNFDIDANFPIRHFELEPVQGTGKWHPKQPPTIDPNDCKHFVGSLKDHTSLHSLFKRNSRQDEFSLHLFGYRNEIHEAEIHELENQIQQAKEKLWEIAGIKQELTEKRKRLQDTGARQELMVHNCRKELQTLYSPGSLDWNFSKIRQYLSGFFVSGISDEFGLGSYIPKQIAPLGFQKSDVTGEDIRIFQLLSGRTEDLHSELMEKIVPVVQKYRDSIEEPFRLIQSACTKNEGSKFSVLATLDEDEGEDKKGDESKEGDEDKEGGEEKEGGKDKEGDEDKEGNEDKNDGNGEEDEEKKYKEWEKARSCLQNIVQAEIKEEDIETNRLFTEYQALTANTNKAIQNLQDQWNSINGLGLRLEGLIETAHKKSNAKVLSLDHKHIQEQLLLDDQIFKDIIATLDDDNIKVGTYAGIIHHGSFFRTMVGAYEHHIADGNNCQCWTVPKLNTSPPTSPEQTILEPTKQLAVSE